MPFLNRIRLPLYLKTPQFPTEANRFRLSNGESKTLSVTIRKVYEMQSDYMGEAMHQRLVIALNHDTVNIEGDKYIGGASVEGDYEIQWPDFLDYPLGQATVKLQATPFNFTNDNCQTCEQASQLSLVDDDIGNIAEGATDTVNVYNNDTICCYPVNAEIVSFDTDYLSAASIDELTGIVSLTVKNPVASVGNIVLATYRVLCPDGSYDEADIYGSITGSIAGCEVPSSFNDTTFDAGIPYTATVTWVDPVVPPALGYEWQITLTGSETVIDSGTTAINSVDIPGLASGTSYTVYVRSICSGGAFSAYGNTQFLTPGSGAYNCGQFEIRCDDGTVEPNVYRFSSMDCNGVITPRFQLNLTSTYLCLLHDILLEPVYFESTNPGLTYIYVEPC